jgi:Na+-transporting NADH:ubiquinone oxidoreductase subunit C
MRPSVHTLIYALLLGIVCSILLTGTGRFTATYRDANQRAEKFRHILGVLEVPVAEDASAGELLEVFEKNVRVTEVNGSSRYAYVDTNGAARIVAIDLAGPGLWGKIKGFLALDPDLKTIRGITFHEQEETPGLGGEIASDWFRRQFKGKRTTDAEGVPGIRIRKGRGATAINEVDGISGATMTCEKVEALINKAIAGSLGGGTDAR